MRSADMEMSSESSDSLDSVDFDLSSLGGLAILHAALEIGSYAVPYNQDYEMYKIHRQGQPPPKKETKTKDEEEEEKIKEKVTIIPIHDDEEMRRLERKRRTQEDLVGDFVKILEQMMNPRQAVTSFLSAVTGILAAVVSLVYLGRLPDSAVKAKELVMILIVYGIVQVLLATTFFATCVQTSIAVSKGVKDAVQIVIGLLVALSYLTITFISTLIGVFGFYKTLCIVSFVEYNDTQSGFFCPQPIFYTALIVFVLHIILIVLKCCCCK